MTALDLIDIVLSKIGETTIAGPEIEGILPLALSKLSVRVADSSDRPLLRKDFAITVTAGVADLTTHLTATEPLLMECINHAEIYSSGGTTPWQFLPDRVQLGLTRPQMFIYFAIDKSDLRTRNTDGSLTSLGVSATITASYVPLLASVPVLLEDELVNLVIQELTLAPAATS